MGAYNDLHIDKKFLPEELKNQEHGWQTKSHDLVCAYLIIDFNGNLLIKNGEILCNDDYNGEIRFYKPIDKIWYEFIAFFEKGIMFKIIKDNQHRIDKRYM